MSSREPPVSPSTGVADMDLHAWLFMWVLQFQHTTSGTLPTEPPLYPQKVHFSFHIGVSSTGTYLSVTGECPYLMSSSSMHIVTYARIPSFSWLNCIPLHRCFYLSNSKQACAWCTKAQVFHYVLSLMCCLKSSLLADLHSQPKTKQV